MNKKKFQLLFLILFLTIAEFKNNIKPMQNSPIIECHFKKHQEINKLTPLEQELYLNGFYKPILNLNITPLKITNNNELQGQINIINTDIINKLLNDLTPINSNFLYNYPINSIINFRRFIIKNLVKAEQIEKNNPIFLLYELHQYNYSFFDSWNKIIEEITNKIHCEINNLITNSISIQITDLTLLATTLFIIKKFKICNCYNIYIHLINEKFELLKPYKEIKISFQYLINRYFLEKLLYQYYNFIKNINPNIRIFIHTSIQKYYSFCMKNNLNNKQILI
ncbi:hypothetical protein GF322_03415 [Candidatus Dependentiae bacterium]|nr:hypothetical protein [Candidatus Dependentiae bacterium]